MEMSNRTEQESKADLLRRLDIAIELARDIRRQWEGIGEFLEEQHKVPLAA